MAAAAGPRVEFSHINTTSAQLVLLHSKWNSRRAMSNAARPSAYWTLYADSAATERAVAIDLTFCSALDCGKAPLWF